MDQLQERKRSMYYVVEDYLATVPAATIATMPEFGANFGKFTDTVAKIRQQSESQTTNRVGYRMVKNDLKLDMTKQAIDVASRIKAYAINIGDVVLREEMYQRTSNLFRKPDTICADICRYIQGKGVALLASLAPYGVDTALLDALKDSIDAYTDYIPKPRAGIVARGQATMEMRQLFGNSDAVLRHMDALVTMLQYSEPEFYAAYFSSRKIIRPGYRTLSLAGLVIDADGAPLSKVSVVIEDTGITRKTTLNGGFQVKDLDSGMYSIRLSKPGYADTLALVAITATERTDFTSVMELETAKAKKVA